MVQDHYKKLLLAVLSSVSQVGETLRPGASCAHENTLFVCFPRSRSDLQKAQSFRPAHEKLGVLLSANGRKMNMFMNINKPL